MPSSPNDQRHRAAAQDASIVVDSAYWNDWHLRNDSFDTVSGPSRHLDARCHLPLALSQIAIWNAENANSISDC